MYYAIDIKHKLSQRGPGFGKYRMRFIFNGIFEMQISARKRMKSTKKRVFETPDFRIYCLCIKHNGLIGEGNGLLIHSM